MRSLSLPGACSAPSATSSTLLRGTPREPTAAPRTCPHGAVRVTRWRRGSAERPFEEGCLSRNLSRARTGDEEALEALLHLLRPVLLRYARAQLFLDPEAEETARDLAQEALVRIVLGLRHCRAEADNQVIAWALAIIRNLCVDYFRTAHVPTFRLSQLLDDDSFVREDFLTSGAGRESPRAGPGRRVLRRVLDEVLGTLPASALRLLKLRVEEDMTWNQIACELGLTRSAAKRRFQRMQARVRADAFLRIEGLTNRDRAAALRYLRRLVR